MTDATPLASEQITQEDVNDADKAAVTRFHAIQVKRIMAGDRTLGDNRDTIEQAFARHRIEATAPLREALAWYGEQARLARLVHSEGDAGRHALADDGGKRARAALAACSLCGDGPHDPDCPYHPVYDSLKDRA